MRGFAGEIVCMQAVTKLFGFCMTAPPPPPGGGGGVWAVGMGNLCPYNNTDRHIFTQNIHTFMHTYGGNTS